MTGRVAYSAFQQQRRSRPLPKGGSGKLTEALAKFIEAHNGVVLVNKPVTKLIIESGRCVGVECGDGSSYRGSKSGAFHTSISSIWWTWLRANIRGATNL